MHEIVNKIENILKNEFGKKPKKIEPILQSGSNRSYLRVFLDNDTIIATYNTDKLENKSFIYLQKFFSSLGLPVPTILKYFEEECIYFQQDLGDITFYSYLQHLKQNSKFDEIEFWYRKILNDLINFQFSASKGLDFSQCYPVAEFNKQSILWDLNYFKYMFLRLSYASFHEQKLEEDFELLTQKLLSADSHYFVYRDFQSRNIMLFNNKLYYIDFQGGRKGSLFYDVASLLYDAKADLSFDLRERLLNFYFDLLSDKINFDKNEYKNLFNYYVLFRILQALGAYGYRGIYERKEHFIRSIEPALKNIEYLRENTDCFNELTYLGEVLTHQMKNSFLKTYFSNNKSSELLVNILSFTYKDGYPKDETEHGGGFIFDCRALPNPGKVEHLKYYTGEDDIVRTYMEQYYEVKCFLKNVFELVDSSIENYIERGLNYLSVSFGCTGGQHRSVYCAKKLAEHIKQKYRVRVKLTHLNKYNWKT